MAWAIGANYRANSVYGFAGQEAQCPRDTTLWFFHNGTGYERKKLNIRSGHNWHHAPNDTDHIVWNIHRRKWDREQIFWDHGHLVNQGGAHGGEKEEENATENEEVVAENGTADGAEEEDKNATESEGADDTENETSEIGEEEDRNATESRGITAAEHETTESGEKEVARAEDGWDLETVQAQLRAFEQLPQQTAMVQAELLVLRERQRLLLQAAGKNAPEIKGGEAPSGGETHGLQLVPFVLRFFKRVVGLLQG